VQLIEQVPCEQAACPFSVPHELRHVPQLWALAKSASQPLLVSPSQSALFIAHLSGVHSPPLQVRPAAQVELQPPQFLGSLASFASQPLLGSPSQSAVPVRHPPASTLSDTAKC
jgi:hypothetical protein